MCAKFNKAFKKRDATIPESVLRQLEKECLPEGFHYESFQNGTCMISPKGINKILNKDSFILPKELTNISFDDILFYSYNAQESLKFKDDINIKEKEVINIEDIIKYPFDDKKTVCKEIAFSPPTFEEYKIEIEGNGIKKPVVMKRQPSKDIGKIIVKRVDFQDLEISIIFNIKNNKMNFKVDVNIEQCKSLEDVIINLKLYKAFSEGSIKIHLKNDHKINLNELAKDFKLEVDSKIIDTMIIFYEKVLKISKITNTVIEPRENIDTDDIYMIEVLYRTLIEKKPFKENIAIDSISMTVGEKISEKLFSNKNPIDLKTIEDLEIEILGSKISVYSILVMHNLVITNMKYEKSGEDFNYDLKTTNFEGKEIYKTCIYFIDKKSRDSYLNENSDIIKEFENAKKIMI